MKRYALALRLLLLTTGCLGACGVMRRDPETLEALCARQPAAPSCRYLTLPPEAH